MQKSVPVDAKGRVTIPQEFRSDLGDTVVLGRTRQGLLVAPGEKEDFLAEFGRAIKREPRRTGKPKNPSPARMKAVWREGI